MLEACFAYNDLRRRRPGGHIFTPSQQTEMALRGGAGEDDVEAAAAAVGLPEGVTLGQLGHVLTRALEQGLDRQEPRQLTALTTALRDCRLPRDTLSIGRNPLWLPMYGYAGIVWFKLDSLESFIDAVNRLLMLGNRTFWQDGGSGKAYRLYLLPRDADFKTNMAKNDFLDNGYYVEVNCQGKNNYRADCAVWRQVVLQLIGQTTLASGENAPQLGIPAVRAAAYGPVIFVGDLYEPFPWDWEPPATSASVLKLMLDPDSDDWRPDVAYIRRPDNTSEMKAWCWNTLGNDFARAVRVLSPGRIAGRPGSPAVPHYLYTLTGWNNQERTWAFGGLCPPSRMMRKMLEQDPANPVLMSRDLPGQRENVVEPPEGWFYVFVPGSHRRGRGIYQSWNTADDVARLRHGITGAIRRAVGHDNMGQGLRVEIFVPGTKAFMADEILRAEAGDPRKPVNTILLADDSDEEWAKLQALLLRRREYLTHTVRERFRQRIAALDDDVSDNVVPSNETILKSFPLLLTARPVFPRYTLRWGSNNTPSVPWDPTTASLADVRTLIMALAPHGERRAAGSKCFHLRAEAPPPQAQLQDENMLNLAPEFIIKPDMTEYDWGCVQSLITYSRAVVTCAHASDLCPQYDNSDSSAPFGVRNTSDQQPQLLWADPNTTVAVWNPQQDDTTRYSRGVKRLLNVHRELREKTYNARDTNVRGTAEFVLGGPLPRRRPKEPLTEAYTEARQRQRAFTEPQSVYRENDMPLHGPAIEPVISTGSLATPLVTTAVPTPTEGHQMQRDLNELRNEALNRSQRCPFPHCDQVFPLDAGSRRAALSTHVMYAHKADKCNFCDELLFHSWTDAQRMKHFNDRHMGVMISGGQLEDQDISLPYQHRSNTGEAEMNNWAYCPRCGRNHIQLDVAADRKYHDGVCYRPDANEESGRWCGHCGQRMTESTASDHVNGACLGKTQYNTVPRPPYCLNCGISLGVFSQAYRQKHVRECKPLRTGQVLFCPFCGRDFQAVAHPRDHVRNCYLRPGRSNLPDDGDYRPPRTRTTTTAAGRKRGRPSDGPTEEVVESRAPKRARTSTGTTSRTGSAGARDLEYVSPPLVT